MIMKEISFRELLKGTVESHSKDYKVLGEEHLIMTLVNAVPHKRAYDAEMWIRATLGCEIPTPMYSAPINTG
jgi:hypothetical protein